MEFVLDGEISYELSLKRLAVESMGTNSTLTIFKNFIPKSIEVIRSFVPTLSNFSNYESDTKLKNSDRRNLMNAVKLANFMDYGQILVFVPEGFKAKYIPYMEVLLDQGKDIFQNTHTVLKEYEVSLSMFLSDADIRKSQSSSVKGMSFDKLKKARLAQENQIAEFFDKKNSTLSRQPLKVVVERFADFNEVFALEEKLIALRKQQNYHALVQEVQKVSDILGLIKARLDSGDIEDVSGSVAKDLAEGAHEVAKNVEYVATYCYFLETMIGSVNNTADHLTKLFLK